MGLSKKTWSSYRTAEKMLLKCFHEKRRRLELPIKKNDILVFIEWLGTERKVRATTIESYLAGVRQMHTVKGIDPPEIRSRLVKQVLKGISNKNATDDRTRQKTGRLAMTSNIMLLLKELVRTWDQKPEMKIMVWSICTLAYAGSFRIHEILCRNQNKFDPDFDLLWEDVTLTENGPGDVTGRLSVKLKCPKESKNGKGTVVDVFESGNQLCPVKAFKKWRSHADIKKGFPVFELDGAAMTGNRMNKILSELLEPQIGRDKGRITTHSFRAGIATLLAEKGFDDDEIMTVGRWHSRAYEAYVKKPRTRRASMAKAIARMGI